MDAKSHSCKGAPCTKHGNESISPHTRTLYPPAGPTRSSASASPKEEGTEGASSAPTALAPFFSSPVYLSSYRDADPPFPFLFLAPSLPTRESGQVRKSQSTVRTLNARPCSHFRRKQITRRTSSYLAVAAASDCVPVFVLPLLGFFFSQATRRTFVPVCSESRLDREWISEAYLSRYARIVIVNFELNYLVFFLRLAEFSPFYSLLPNYATRSAILFI